jgi:hypothetical protein
MRCCVGALLASAVSVVVGAEELPIVEISLVRPSCVKRRMRCDYCVGIARRFLFAACACVTLLACVCACVCMCVCFVREGCSRVRARSGMKIVCVCANVSRAEGLVGQRTC